MTSFLKGRIRGAKKTQLGTSLGVTQGQTVRALDKSYTVGGPREREECVVREVLKKDMDGETVLIPFVKVDIIRRTRNGVRVLQWNAWLRILNPPDDLEIQFGGLEGVSELKPNGSARFTSQSRKIGYVTLGAYSADIDDYSGGEIKERDGMLIV